MASLTGVLVACGIILGGAGAVYGGSMMITGHAPFACGGMMSQCTAGAPRGDVTMTMTTFEPAVLTVPVGRTVTWTNPSTVEHTVTSDTLEGALISERVAPGATWSFTFTQAGTYDYHCALHASRLPNGTYEGQVGRIIVR